MNNNLKQESVDIVLLPWKTKYFIITFAGYIILFLLGCSTIILSSVVIAYTYNIDNQFISGIGVIFGISIIIISIYWYMYNNQKILNLKQVKRKSIILDVILISYIFTLYVLMLYITYISFGINIVFHNTPLMNSMMWCCITSGVTQVLAYMLNVIAMNKQKYYDKIITGNDVMLKHHWWLNLVYSYWLDRIYFSAMRLNSLNSNNIFMIDQEDLNSHFRANEVYLDTFKYLNIFKGLVQNSFSAIMTTLMSVAVMLIAPIAYWLHKLSSDIDFDSFIIIFWVVVSIISLICYHFIITNKFQLIKSDNEKYISNNYRSIRISFQQLINSNLISYDLSEKDKLRWLAIIRKYLMYHQPSIENPIDIAILDSVTESKILLQLSLLEKNILSINFIKI